MSTRMFKRVGLGLAAGLAAVILIALIVIVAQAKRAPTGRPDYVALGSSFAAGAGLGPLQADSPILCARSVNGYPQQLARQLDLSIVDMSCGGAVTRNVLRGGQFFQGPQVRVIGPETRLVTLTIGGNDIGYVGDLSLFAGRKDRTLFGALVRMTWRGPKAPEDRGYAALRDALTATVRDIRRRAPRAVIVVATYPRILPDAGTCDAVGLTEAEADTMRGVGDALAEVTRAAATEAGARVVDMHRLGADHDACSASPWVTGWKNAGPAPFHPTLNGAKATAAAIAKALD